MIKANKDIRRQKATINDNIPADLLMELKREWNDLKAVNVNKI